MTGHRFERERARGGIYGRSSRKKREGGSVIIFDFKIFFKLSIKKR